MFKRRFNDFFHPETEPAETTSSDVHLHQSRLLRLLDICEEGVFHIDSVGKMTFYTPRFYESLGLSNLSIHIGQFYPLIHPEDLRDTHIIHELSRISPGKQCRHQFRLKGLDGQYHWLESLLVCHEDSSERYLIGTHKDISLSRASEQRLNQSSFYDASSGLYNAKKLQIDLEDYRKKSPQPFSLVYINTRIDNLHGYGFTQEVRQSVIDYLDKVQSRFHYGDHTLYRVSEDDYAILIKNANNEEHQRIISQAQHIVSEFPHQLTVRHGNAETVLSIGFYPFCDRAQSSENLITIASQTCQYAAQHHLPRFAIYDKPHQAKIERYFYVENQLKTAIERNEITVKFQPIMDSVGHRVRSFEALVRWRSPDYGMISPDEFIPVAERKNLIVELGYVVIRQACDFLKIYNQHNHANLNININVSVRQLLNSAFPDAVLAITSEYGLPPESIVLELTETFILDNNGEAISQLNRLKELGFMLSLDDFGAGYSSVNSFFNLPFNQIKIDREFALRTLTDSASSKYLAFLIQLCTEKSITIVIEGIESADMLNKFSTMGAHYLQGYWFAKPMSIASGINYHPEGLSY